MSLASRATVDDVSVICNYLATKPTGATFAEAKAVIDARHLDVRKVAAIKAWGLIEDASGRMRLTEKGRRAAKDKGAKRSEVLLEVVRATPAYAAVVERAGHKQELTVSAADVAAHWHEHFKPEVSDSNEIINEQAVCFFQVAQGADLGTVVIGRKGSPTRFEFDPEAAARFINGHEAPAESDEKPPVPAAEKPGEAAAPQSLHTPQMPAPKGNRVFLTHGRNKKIMHQVKELVAFGKFVPVVAEEHETPSKPVPDKVLDDMRSCQAAVIHVGMEGVLLDAEGREHPQINDNVLIEIGAAMALYKRNFILLVEEGVKLPSNLQGLYECRYAGDELSMTAAMKLLKAFNEFE